MLSLALYIRMPWFYFSDGNSICICATPTWKSPFIQADSTGILDLASLSSWYSYYSIVSPLSFLALAIHSLWLLLTSTVSGLLIVAFSLGIWLVLFFSFLNSTPTINCWLSPCFTHSDFAKEILVHSFSYGHLFWAEFSYLSHLCCSQGHGFLNLSEPTSQGIVVGLTVG